MDHNLGDSLNLEGSIGVEFTNADEMVVSEGVISMDSAGHDGDIPMEFEHMTEQQMMMDTGNEEIIDFMGDRIQLSEFSMEDNSHSTIPLEAEQSSFLTSQPETIVDIQLPQTVPSTSYMMQPELSKVAPLHNNSPQKKNDQYVITTVSRQVSLKSKPQYNIKAPPKIAPKPPPPTPIALLANRSQIMKLSSITQQKPVLKQYAIAPKPDVKYVGTMMSNANVRQGAQKVQPVLAQIGKQLVMLPSKTGPKFKLVTSTNASGNISIRNESDLAQLISRKGVTSQDGKPIKVIVQGQRSVEAPAMLTKVITTSGTVTSGPANYITVQSKKVPITPGMMLQSPKRSFVKLHKKQMISLSPTKVYPTGTQGSPKKIFLSEVQAKSLLSTGSSIQTSGAKTQIHQINVPGKGVQYIRLVTNPTATQAKTQHTVVSKGKTYVFADNTGANKNQKLLRIAPLNSKAGQMFMRSSQSLLAPISQSSDVAAESKNLQAEATPNIKIEMIDNERVEEQLVDNLEGEEIEYQEIDDRSHSLQTLIDNSVRESVKHQEEDDSRSSVERKGNEAPLIVVPPDYHLNEKPIVPDVDDAHYSNDKRVNVELVDYQSDPEHLQEMIPPGLDMRPRKACNCTKSQCLKLYCDCFANGEFCNRCNCINCHNNLENEELRQKAIRGCLDRNPNAFRPKIGKTKSGGPEIVRRHNKGCNCKRSGCLKNYCECFEAKIACSAICKCVGCRNVQESVSRRLAAHRLHHSASQVVHDKQPCSFMTTEVIEAVCQCLIASASETNAREPPDEDDPIRDVIDEFARCLQDIIDHARNEAPTDLLLERC